MVQLACSSSLAVSALQVTLGWHMASFHAHAATISARAPVPTRGRSDAHVQVRITAHHSARMGADMHACHATRHRMCTSSVSALAAFPGDQLSPRGSTVTTSLPFAPGFGGGTGASHGRGAQAVKGDPDYTPPGNARCA